MNFRAAKMSFRGRYKAFLSFFDFLMMVQKCFYSLRLMNFRAAKMSFRGRYKAFSADFLADFDADFGSFLGHFSPSTALGCWILELIKVHFAGCGEAIWVFLICWFWSILPSAASGWWILELLKCHFEGGIRPFRLMIFAVFLLFFHLFCLFSSFFVILALFSAVLTRFRLFLEVLFFRPLTASGWNRSKKRSRGVWGKAVFFADFIH